MKGKLVRPVHKTIAVLLFTGLLFSACSSDLWGNYDPYLTRTPLPPSSTASPSPDPTWTASPPPPTPTESATLTPIPTESPTPLGPTSTPRQPILYTSQSGDSLSVVAVHFGVQPAEISSLVTLPSAGFIDPNTAMVIPDRLGQTTPTQRIIPDSEVVLSPSTVQFDVQAYAQAAGGKINTYKEYLASTAWTTGPQAVERVAFENSVNPRLLLALIQYISGWVQGQPSSLVPEDYPLGFIDPQYKGLFQQMSRAVLSLSTGYYGWRSGKLTELTFSDGKTIRLAPELNAGTVALEYFFSTRYSYDQWLQVVDPQTGFMSFYRNMFGDPWARAQTIEPLFPPGLNQPVLSLPFEVGVLWNLTGGPHPAWDQASALAALDFAPPAVQPGCAPSDAWVVAAASGRVVRSAFGLVVEDLDGDGYEQTGWDLLYMHIATKDHVAVGVWLNAGDRIGHPSCEGGLASGTHVHIARKYNGEWVEAGGPLPFVLSGWVVHEGDAPYKGTLTKGNQIVTANSNSMQESQIARRPGE